MRRRVMKKTQGIIVESSSLDRDEETENNVENN
jgi:hypothetical protein